MFCIHCGKPLPDNAKFCSQCGKPCSTTQNEDNIAEKANWELMENIDSLISNSKIKDDVTENAYWDSTFTSSEVNKVNENLPTYQTPEIIYFKVNKDYANEGEYLLFSWEVRNAYKVAILIIEAFTKVLQHIDVPSKAEQQAISLSFNTNDSLMVKLQAYDMFGNKIDDKSYKSTLFIYKTENSHPVIIYFVSDKYEVSENELIKLTWNVTNAQKITCSAIKEKLGSYGEKTITFSSEHCDIHLYAENEYGREEKVIHLEEKEGVIFRIFKILVYGGISAWGIYQIILFLIKIKKV
ncbi:MAG: zinc ribbon domain-containing protein [Odoribacter splanchnicus]